MSRAIQPVGQSMTSYMQSHDFPLTFRVLGPIHTRRLRVPAFMALEAYRQCEDKARVQQESYLGMFCFGDDFAEHLERTGTTKDFTGPTWAPLIWWDVDRGAGDGGVEQAIVDTRRLMQTLQVKYGVPPECLLPFISGGKGCHLALPTALWGPPGSDSFSLVAREFAEQVASSAVVPVDSGIYDRVRAFRAPNSRHPKTGLHKRFVLPQEFELLTLEDALLLAGSPASFDWPGIEDVGTVAPLAEEWRTCEAAVKRKQIALEERRKNMAEGGMEGFVNRLTMDLIRGETVSEGNRHRVIYSAARNLAEAGASRHLVSQLLREASLDTGLPPREVDRQLECGFLAAMPKESGLTADSDGSAEGEVHA